MENKGKENCLSSLMSKLRWAIYGLKISIFKPKAPTQNQLAKSVANRKIKKTIFLFTCLLFPTIQFLIFYVGVNLNSILLAFQRYDKGRFILVGFENFVKVIDDIFISGSLSTALKNSGIQFVVSLVLGMPIHVVVAYVIFKKVPAGGFLKVMLFLPQMVSSLVFVISFKFFCQYGLPEIINDKTIFFLNPKSPRSFWSVLLFGQWMNFAGGLVIYLSAMSSISSDVIEYGQLEPLTSIKELWYIIIPSIFPTIITYLVVQIAGFFTNYGYFVSFFAGNHLGAATREPFESLGYYFFVVLLGNSDLSLYPYAAAAGIMFTLVAAPVTLIVKSLLEKFGPSEN